MAQTAVVLEQQAMGLESTRFTAVAAVRKFYGTLTTNQDQGLIVPPEDNGTYFGAYKDRIIQGLIAARCDFNGPMYFQDLAWWGSLALKGGVSPTGGTGTPPNKVPYTWTFTPSASSDDIKSATWEKKFAAQAYKMNGCLLNTFNLSGAAAENRNVMLAASFIGQQRSTVTYAAPADSTRWPFLPAQTKIYIDAAGGTIGTTQLSGQVISWHFGINNNLNPLTFCDGNYFIGDIERGYKVVTAGLVVRFTGTTEYTNWAAATERLIRIEMTGPSLDTATYQAGSNQKVQIDLGGRWTAAVINRSGAITTLGLTFLPHYTTAAALNSDVKLTYIGDQADVASA